MTGAIRRRAFGIGPEEATLERRGFEAASPAAQAALEAAGREFVRGYVAALEDGGAPRRGGAPAPRLAALDAELRAGDPATRGFAYEGAAMGLTLLDSLTPWRRDRLAAFVDGPAQPHVYMAHVGAGWAFARLRRPPAAARRLDPLLRWLALDGYGFHEGYFHPDRSLGRGRVPRRFAGYAARAFDQGLGRSLWFAAGARPARVVRAIGRLAPDRHADVWSGVALAATYAGGAEEATIGVLRNAGAAFRPHLAQGAAFAATARARAGNLTEHTAMACELLAGCDPRTAAELSEATARELPPDGAEPAYEVWRARLRAALAPIAPAQVPGAA